MNVMVKDHDCGDHMEKLYYACRYEDAFTAEVLLTDVMMTIQVIHSVMKWPFKRDKLYNHGGV